MSILLNFHVTQGTFNVLNVSFVHFKHRATSTVIPKKLFLLIVNSLKLPSRIKIKHTLNSSPYD